MHKEFLFEELPVDQKQKMMGTAILPRPIALVSTRNNEGVANLAPFSWFTIASVDPPVLSITVRHLNGELKDTARNILETGEFVIHVPNEAMMQLVQDASFEFGSEVDEFAKLELSKIDSKYVAGPALEQAPIRYECKLVNQVSFKSETTELGTDIFFGQVVAAFVDESVMTGNRIDIEKLQPIGRVAGNNFATIGDIVPVAFSELTKIDH